MTNPTGDNSMTIAVWINEKSGEALVFPTLREAQAQGNAGTICRSSVELQSSTVPTHLMVDIYNRMTNRTIKKFADRATAAARVWHELTSSFKIKEQKPLQVAPGVDADKVVAAAKASKPTKPAAKKPAEKKPTSGRRNLREGALFIKEGATSPFRENSGNGRTWAMISEKPGKKFDDYVDMGARPQAISYLIREGLVELKD